MMVTASPLQCRCLSVPAAVKKGKGCGPASSAPLSLKESEQDKHLITSPSRQQKRQLNLQVELAKIGYALWPAESGLYIVMFTVPKHSPGCDQ